MGKSNGGKEPSPRPSDKPDKPSGRDKGGRGTGTGGGTRGFIAEVKHYTVISEYGKVKLIEEVNKALKEGWQPLGGISSFIYVMNKELQQTAEVYSQALVKYKSS